MAFGKLFVISAPSGAGKTSLVNAVLAEYGKKYQLDRAITYTTRPPREGEVDGSHYHFISVDEFKEKITQNFFIEWSTWYDHYYGSPVTILKKVEEGSSFIMVLDRPGAKDVLQTYPQTVLIWIAPPNIEELKRRLNARGDNAGSIESRLRKAVVEIEQENDEQFYKYHVINDDFKVAVAQIAEILKKELPLV